MDSTYLSNQYSNMHINLSDSARPHRVSYLGLQRWSTCTLANSLQILLRHVDPLLDRINCSVRVEPQESMEHFYWLLETPHHQFDQLHWLVALSIRRKECNCCNWNNIKVEDGSHDNIDDDDRSDHTVIISFFISQEDDRTVKAVLGCEQGPGNDQNKNRTKKLSHPKRSVRCHVKIGALLGCQELLSSNQMCCVFNSCSVEDLVGPLAGQIQIRNNY